MIELYPDLRRGGDRPPSVIAAEARAAIDREPVMWRAEYDSAIGPSETLAIVGAIVLSAELGNPCGWSGLALRGRADLLAALAGSQVGTRADDVMLVRLGDSRMLRLRHETSRLWTGYATGPRIWEAARGFVAGWVAERPAADTDGYLPPYVLPLDRDIDEPLRGGGTGYDDRIVADALRDGFAVNLHDDIVMVGARPAVEMLALIGAAYIEAAGRWPARPMPRLPRLAGAVLRDVLDLDRLLLVQRDSLPVAVVNPARRARLEAR